jgi:hypothetical protein
MKNKKNTAKKAKQINLPPITNVVIRRFEPMRLTKKGKLKFIDTDEFKETYDSYIHAAIDLERYVKNDTSKKASEKNYIIVELFHS